MGLRSFRVVAISSFLIGAACSDSQHPDFKRYDYLYMNGAFVGPRRDFPEGPERAQWKCYDGASRHTFDCTFVRGGWDRFQYVYRAKSAPESEEDASEPQKGGKRPGA